MKLSKEILIANINRDILDNSVGAVSPQDIRKNLLDIIDSVSLLTEYGEINALNISTADQRTTRVGVDTLSKRQATGYASLDNVAIGYSALKSQIDAKQNTAVGSFALTCNMYGVDNVALGFHSLGSVINGYGNIGIGGYSLNGNKEGNFNIAIGHGAAYYVDRNNSYQFYLAAHPVDGDYICANSEGTGLVPLLRGDLSQDNLSLGIGVRELHQGASLQVAGNIHPSTSQNYDIGSSVYRFRDLYLTNKIFFGDNDSITHFLSKFVISNNVEVKGSLDVDEGITLTGDIVSSNGKLSIGSSLTATSAEFSEGVVVGGHLTPSKNAYYDLGDIRNKWANAHIYNLYCNGVAHFNQMYWSQQSYFRNKTIYLGYENSLDTIDGGGADSLFTHYDPNLEEIAPSGTLIDEELAGAGLRIASSGIDYYREYELTFKPQNHLLKNLSLESPYSRSCWFSNISLETASGRHVKTDRIINDNKIGIFTYDNDIGLSIESGVFNFGEERVISEGLVGIGDFNLIANSGKKEGDEYVLGFISPSGGVNIFQDFLDNAAVKEIDQTDYKRRGFRVGYISNSELVPPNYFNEYTPSDTRRFIISSYNDSEANRNCFTLMNNDEGFGCVGISNFQNSESMLPDRMLNLRSRNDAYIRATAENVGNHFAGIELLARENCLKYGVQINYRNFNNEGQFNCDIFENAVKRTIFSAKSNGNLNVRGDINDTGTSYLNIGGDNASEATIGFKLAASSFAPDQNEKYAQIFARQNLVNDPPNVLSFMDTSGNIFNISMIQSSTDGSILDGPLKLDVFGNTFGGLSSPNNRNAINASVVGNTAIGFESLKYASTATVHNTIIGYKAGSNAQIGNNNVIIGSECIADLDNNILIGKDLIATGSQLKIGFGSTPLIAGDFLNKITYLSGSLYVQGDGSDKAIINHDRFTFSESLTLGTQATTLMRIVPHSENHLTNIETYNSISNRDYVYISADLRVRGSILLSDGSAIHNGDFLDDIQKNKTDIVSVNQKIIQNNTDLENIDDVLNGDYTRLVVEGFVAQDINTSLLPNTFNHPPYVFKIRRQIINANNRYEQDNPDNTNLNLVDVVLRDPHLSVRKGDFVIAIRVNGEYRPISITGAP